MNVRYEAPRSLAEAVHLINADPEARIFAGGTDLLVQFRAGLRRPTAFVDVKRIPDLTSITIDRAGLRLGAAAAAADASGHAEAKRRWPRLAEAIQPSGPPPSPARGPVGGILC